MLADAVVATRLASASCWLLLAAVLSSYCAHVCLRAPRSLLLFNVFGPLVSQDFYVSAFTTFVCALIPTLAQWWFVVHPKPTSTALLSKVARRLPGWRYALWIGGPVRALKALLLLIAATSCGWLFLTGVPGASAPGRATLWYVGASTGVAQVVVFLSSSAYLIEYPIIQRKRWLRLKDRVPAVLATAATAFVYSGALAAVLFALLPLPVPSLAQLAASLVGSASCCALWAFATAVTRIVLSERLFLSHYEHSSQFSVLAMLVERLCTLKHPIDEALSLQEVYNRSNFYGLRFWEDLFRDHTGAQLWAPLATHCLAQLAELTKMLNLFVAAQNVAPKDAKAVQWNSRAGSSMRSLPGPTKEQLFVDDWLRRRGQACCWCAAIVAEVSRLSRAHDHSALLQMPPPGVPGFADVVQVLLQNYALLDRFMLYRSRVKTFEWLAWLPLNLGRALGLVSRSRDLTSSGSNSDADALHDCLLQCLHLLVQEFGEGVPAALSRSKWASPVTDKTLDLPSLASALCGG